MKEAQDAKTVEHTGMIEALNVLMTTHNKTDQMDKEADQWLDKIHEQTQGRRNVSSPLQVA